MRATKEDIAAMERLAKPHKELPFTLRDLKAAVPAEYFEASVATSCYYIAKDLVQFAVTAYVASFLLGCFPGQDAPSTLIRAVIWLAHAFCQGTTGFGLWVIAHECGHQAYFGNRKKLNNAVGLVLHSCMLVPFHSWRITHGTHHRYTNNIRKDTAFPPQVKEMMVMPQWYEISPLFEFLHLLVYQFLGFPFYLAFNWAGQTYPSQRCNHFDPRSPIFKPSEAWDVIVSDIGFGMAVAGLGFWSWTYGFSHMVCWYGLPYLMCNFWLVTVTLLQHHHPEVPHYDDEEWDFVKGALCTVDRDYSTIINKWLHHITDAHVAHHLFSTMPFYHAVKATPYLKKRLGQYYMEDHRALPVQMMEAFRCFVGNHVIWHRYPNNPPPVLAKQA